VNELGRLLRWRGERGACRVDKAASDRVADPVGADVPRHTEFRVEFKHDAGAVPSASERDRRQIAYAG
jgi:hypothetical protein